jgi:hypothetical protein
MSLYIGVCPSCTEEVVFNKPTDSVICGAGHKGSAPETYREATEAECALTLDAYRTITIQLVFPYGAVRAFYAASFFQWAKHHKIEFISVSENPQRPWTLDLVVHDAGWSESDAMKATAWWKQVLGKGVTRTNMP